MNKRKSKTKVFYLVSFFSITFLTLYYSTAFMSPKALIFNLKQVLLQKVVAEDDNEESVGHDSEDNYVPADTIPDSTTTTTKTTPKTTTTIKSPTTPPPVYVWVPLGDYALDSDKDGLVDAIDPDPKVPQTQYFTDSDNDGVPDVFDKHPGENDFLFVDETDLNNNGIWDSLEN
jgi:hypothetical protein